jgi:hypothetical protein
MKIDPISMALKAAFRRHRTLRMVSGLMFAATVASGFMAWRADRAFAAGEDIPAAQSAVYSQATSEHYSYRFGADKPFLPSNATTDMGEFINAKSFPTAKYCGHCHQEAHA